MGDGKGVSLESIRRGYGDRTWRGKRWASDHMGKINVVGTIDGSRILYVTKCGYSIVSFRPIRRVSNTNALLC